MSNQSFSLKKNIGSLEINSNGSKISYFGYNILKIFKIIYDTVATRYMFILFIYKNVFQMFYKILMNIYEKVPFHKIFKFFFCNFTIEFLNQLYFNSFIINFLAYYI